MCGLGTVGYRIGSELIAEGIDVYGVDIDEDVRLARARSAGIAAASGNAAQAATLRSLGVQEAAYPLLRHRQRRRQPRGRAGRARRESRAAHRPRLFDPDLAERSSASRGLGVSRSVADLAAPAFAAAALGRDVTDAIRTPRRLLLVAHHRAPSTRRWARVERDGALRVLSRERAGEAVTGLPRATERLEPDDVVTVVGT